ncbi:MAG: hypothetical protein ACD_57C00391G0011 [uncultured bacterium]|uniref:Uncharacterized protein n=1 Tax=Candidatus Woesebacteria bacterium RIFCSPHIGHO2_12_FULL_41_24 TaxID=1802510 RepID=A0A1F8AT49_9BACT|nr:MAG: hypothetical protein ACD_57C00391G0011 [uncultured bacterium]OGM12938.1 MAG: hypothetical protein A2W15_01070 [Candidatus Woesebacteria bacterium RBG_16_41_13]OGM28778.1 MAG: hypothetical protein A2873_01775 [Candidatus Woesebacteria bacterium RIFCSPHIGHO2_01_FULL_42_80]OGM34978.1 MAG: hypothetical protein A3D84_06120 [Candidatus Woesebacteria bacterium RIFCSPHIGHO2_02_FULL_42_20]OGM54669.1 MAG: hypothetical protein A3E44_02480 [Candidatus Woesebacteria bacterium RIFCSPHIGHO2_12_FULL_41
MGELKAVREEITTLSGLQIQVHDHEVRIEKVEKKLNTVLSFKIINLSPNQPPNLQKYHKLRPRMTFRHLLTLFN